MTKKNLKKVYRLITSKRLVSIVLSASIFFAPLSQYSWAAPHTGQTSAVNSVIESLVNSPEAHAQQNAMAESLKDLEQATDSSVPQRTKDVFFITKQTLVILSDKIKSFNYLKTTGKRYSLLADQLPLVVSTNFEQEVKIEIDRAQRKIILQLWKNNQHLADHEIDGFDVVTYARDQEFVTFLDKSGKIFTFDAALARDISFRAPIPIFEVATMDPSLVRDGLASTFKVNGGLPSMPVNPKAIRPLDLAPESPYFAGSFDIYDPVKGEYLGVYDREGLRRFTYLGEAVLNLLAAAVNPGENPTQRIESIHKTGSNPNVSFDANRLLNDLDPALISQIRVLSPNYVTLLTKRANHNHAYQNEIVDRFTGAENDSTRELLIKAQEAGAKLDSNADLRANHKELVKNAYDSKTYQTITEKLRQPRNLKIIGTVVAGLMTTAGAYALWHGVGPAWGIHAIHQLYDNYWPEVLKHAGYRMHAVLSSISILSLMPLLFIVGATYSHVKGLKMDVIKATVKLGLVSFGYLVLPVFHLMARMAQQPNLIQSLQYGVNPFSKATTEAGTARPGINVLKFSSNYESDTERNALILKQLYDRKTKLRALAYSIALLTVSQESKIDPVTIQMLQDGVYTPEQLERVSHDKSFRNLWLKSARELEQLLASIQTSIELDPNKDYRDLDHEAFQKALALARQAVTKVKASKRIPFNDLLSSWRTLGSRLLIGTGRFGVEESQFLINNDPSEFVKKQFFLQFTVDYSLAVPQMTFFGARANMDNAPYMAATPTDDLLQRYMDQHPNYVWDRVAQTIVDPVTGRMIYDHSRYFLWSNPQHLGAMADQVRIYALNANSATALVYDKSRPIYDDSYRPLEDVIYKGVPRAESFLESVWNFTKDSVNLKKAKYGTLWITQIIKRMKVINATALFIIIERVGFAGQLPIDAGLSYLISFFGAHLIYFFVTWDPVQKGMQARDLRLEASLEKLMDSRVTLSQAARFGQDPELATAYVNFMDMYNDKSLDVPDELKQLSVYLKEFMASGKTSLGSDVRENAARATTKLLEFSKSTPPLKTKDNATFNWGIMMAASVATTLAATYLDVMTYSTGRAGLITNLFFAMKVFALVYPTAFLFDRFMSKYDERVKALDSYEGVFEKIKASRNETDRDRAKAYLSALDLYAAYEKPVPNEIRGLQTDVMRFLESNATVMPEVLRATFVEANNKLLQFVRKNPSHTVETYDTTVWDNKLMDSTIRGVRAVKSGTAIVCTRALEAVGLRSQKSASKIPVGNAGDD